MKKRKKSNGLQIAEQRNPVAKYAHRFNKARVFKDKSKYQRQAKHKGREPFPIKSADFIGKGSRLIAYPPLGRNAYIGWNRAWPSGALF
ncbi:DUF7230 family protein [Methylomarinum roseum]|uniref:DUF7230 family protein n=1 Tax=Methylomarinum roseum TaxID=3067653 RepID=UPI00273BD2FD|nr:hypothetical protein [Methylomarinum sp. Ch1-1]MDP4522783.1 hypothetical protein [Methylomarinum sp. Ch1-1]